MVGEVVGGEVVPARAFIKSYIYKLTYCHISVIGTHVNEHNNN